MADVAWPIRAGHGRCRPADADTSQLMCACLGLCYLPLADVECSMRAGHERCRLADAHTPQSMSLNRCAHAMTDPCRPWLMVHAVGRRCLPDAHMPRLMLPDVGRRRCHSSYVHTAQFMRACLGLCYLSLADVECSMRTGHERCRLAVARRPRSMYLSRCAHATADTCRPWMMMHVVGRRRLPDAHMPRQMRRGLD